MGQRGPVGKPPELKLLEGGRGHRPIDLTSMFRPEVGAPAIPRHLTGPARKAWKRLVPELLHYNLLSRLDADMLAMLCQTIGRIELMETSLKARQELLASRGEDPADALVGMTPKGMRIQSVSYQILNREMDKLRHLLAEFGLSPAQRARVSTAIRAQGSLDLVGGSAAHPAQPAAPAGFADFQ